MFIIELILIVYFTYVSLYAFVLAIAGLFYKHKNAPDAAIKHKIAVLIPAYKEDQVIVSVASQALDQQYPAESFEVVIIADSLRSETLDQLRLLPVIVVEVSFDVSTKVKALNSAMAAIGDDYDAAVILDADNIMAPDFLSKMNNLYAIGHRAIQGRRAPKNENTPMAVLDGLSETINNFIYRQGTVALGLSASLNGSGMFFNYADYKRIMGGMNSIGGFDRELELKFLEEDSKVYFAEDAIVYDEKVVSTEVFERQRKRWISSQFFYLRKYFLPGILSLLKGNMVFFNSAILRNIQLPRLLNLGLLAGITVISLVMSHYLHFSSWIWAALLGVNIAAMVIAIPPRLYSVKLLKSVILVPAIFVRMFLLLFKLKGANKTFIHTPHGHVETQTSNAKEV